MAFAIDTHRIYLSIPHWGRAILTDEDLAPLINPPEHIDEASIDTLKQIIFIQLDLSPLDHKVTLISRGHRLIDINSEEGGPETKKIETIAISREIGGFRSLGSAGHPLFTIIEAIDPVQPE